MRMAELQLDPDLEWLDHVQPVGLVVAPILLKELGLAPARQTQADTASRQGASWPRTPRSPRLRDPWAFFAQVLGWDARTSPAARRALRCRRSSRPLARARHDPEPDLGGRELGGGDRPWQLLVRIEAPASIPTRAARSTGWEATPHQRFERLLRETGIFAGVLITEKNERTMMARTAIPELRLVYAPCGETSGHLTFPLRSLATVAGRPMLGGLKLLLDSFRLFTDADDAAAACAAPEEPRGAGRGLDRARRAGARRAARTAARSRCRRARRSSASWRSEQPGHLYEGLLTVLMRLVFILYAEDRDLLPSRTDGRARAIYETSYSLRGLYAKLVEDAALNPDTMDERRGGWGRLLALFRLIHKGHTSRFVQARGGKLFDPERFPSSKAGPTRLIRRACSPSPTAASCASSKA